MVAILAQGPKAPVRESPTIACSRLTRQVGVLRRPIHGRRSRLRFELYHGYSFSSRQPHHSCGAVSRITTVCHCPYIYSYILGIGVVLRLARNRGRLG
jgi:hypothetical protein